MSAPYLEPDTSISSSGHTDGLGRRELYFDRETGAMLERLRVRAEVAAFEMAIRDRVSRLATFEDPHIAKPSAAQRDALGDLTVTSEFVAGTRLSDLLELARDEAIAPGVDVALGYLLDALAAVSVLHSTAGFAHGLIAPERTMITADGQAVFLDAAYGAVVDRLGLSRRRLWTEFGVAAVPGDSYPRLDLEGDLGQVALSAVMLVLGRAMEDADYPDNIPSLLMEVVEVAQIRGTADFAGTLQRFLQRMLPLPGRRSYPSADEALTDLKQLLRREIGIDPCRQALVDFMQQVSVPQAPAVYEPDGYDDDLALDELDEEDQEATPFHAGAEELDESRAVEFDVNLDEHVEPIAPSAPEEEVYELALDVPPELNPFPLDIRRPAFEIAARPPAETLPAAPEAESWHAQDSDTTAPVFESSWDEQHEIEPPAPESLDTAPLTHAIDGGTPSYADSSAHIEVGEPAESQLDSSNETETTGTFEEQPALAAAREDDQPVTAASDSGLDAALHSPAIECDAQSDLPDAFAPDRTPAVAPIETVDSADASSPAELSEETLPPEWSSSADEPESTATEPEPEAPELVAILSSPPVEDVPSTSVSVADALPVPEPDAAAGDAPETVEAQNPKAGSRRKRHQHKSARARKDKLRSTAAPALTARPAAKAAEPPAPAPSPAPTPAPEPSAPASKSGWLVPPERSAKFQPAFETATPAAPAVPTYQPPPVPVTPAAPAHSASGWTTSPQAAPMAPQQSVVPQQVVPQPIVSQPIVSYGTGAPPSPAFPPLAPTPPAMPRFGAPAQRAAATPSAQTGGVEAVTRLTTVKIKAEPPAGYTPAAKVRRAPAAPVEPMEHIAPIFRAAASDAEQKNFPWKLVVAVLIIVAGAIVGGRYYMHGVTLVKAPADETANAVPETDPAPPPVAAKGNTGQVVVKTEPAGVKVLLDGQPVGESPVMFNAPAGRHTLTFESSSGSIKKAIKVVANKSLSVEMPVFGGWISVIAPFVVEVFEDGKSLGTTEQGRLALAPGHHTLALHNADLGFGVEQSVEISPGGVSSIRLDPKGSANLNAIPWAEVWTGGHKIGDTPIANLQLPLGSQEFIFKHPQFGERRVTTVVRANQPAAIAVDFTKP